MATTESRVDKNLAKLEAQLDLWTTKLDEVSKDQLAELKSRLATARSKLDEAKAAGGEKWETLKDGVEKIWQELDGTFRKLIH